MPASFHDGGPVILFTNENVAQYLNKIGGVKGKDVLSVAGSGDHAIEAYVHGAHHVDTFDINQSQHAVQDLKLMMLKNLTREQFINDIVTYKLVKPLSSEKLRRDAVNLIREIDSAGVQISLNYSMRCISYLQNKGLYNKAVEYVPEKLDFIHAHVLQLPVKLTRRYDVILLSNILEYVQNGSHIESIVSYYDNVLEPLACNNLNPGGVICFDYMWGYELSSPKCKRYEAFWESFAKSLNKRLSCGKYRIAMHKVASTQIRPARPDFVFAMYKLR